MLLVFPDVYIQVFFETFGIANKVQSLRDYFQLPISKKIKYNTAKI